MQAHNEYSSFDKGIRYFHGNAPCSDEWRREKHMIDFIEQRPAVWNGYSKASVENLHRLSSDGL